MNHMKKIVLLFLFFVQFSSFGQEINPRNEFKNGLRDGSGVYIYPDGGKHEGQWKNGKKEGKGVSTLTNGNRIEGEFKDGKLLPKEKINN